MHAQRIHNNPNHINQILQFELNLVGYFLILPKLHHIFTQKCKKNAVLYSKLYTICCVIAQYSVTIR